MVTLTLAILSIVVNSVVVVSWSWRGSYGGSGWFGRVEFESGWNIFVERSLL
jgi:hypothetical protein